MAMFNEILTGRYNRLLQRLLDMKGDAPAPQLSGDIHAGIELESDRFEYKYLKSENAFWVGAGIAGSAGVVSTIQIRNPANSGQIAVFEGLILSTGGNSELLVSTLGTLSGPIAGGDGAIARRDSRLTGGSNGLLISTGNVAPTIAANGGRALAAANTPVLFPAFFLLHPTYGFQMSTVALNVALSITAWGYTRAAEPGELT